MGGQGDMQSLLKAFLAAVAAAALCAPASANIRPETGPGAMTPALLNATARLIAGLPPQASSRDAHVQTAAWRQHSEFMQATWARLNSRQAWAMAAWRDAELGRSCPAGKTMMYPFSGPDFLSAHWLFPGCETMVMFGLEHIGEIPGIGAMNERELAQLLGDVRAAMGSFVERNYFITQNMARQMRTSSLRGVLPILMLSMALTGAEIVGVAPHEIAPLQRNDSQVRGPAVRRLKGVTIEYRAQGAAAIRRVHYFSVDATDRGLASYPEFIAFVRGLGLTTTFIKSASYLLHGNEFLAMRNALLDITGVFVQDDTGLPFAMLDKGAWQVQLYGRYSRPIPPFQGSFQSELNRAYGAHPPAPLPFTFGYQFRDFRDQRSNLMIAHRTSTELTGR